ncbi:MAG: glycosyltransferase family 2 protein [Proteobacteria bacterium]|nr:glycosyltransferase family 2 protein [Pseudomonadota bacterium]
MRRVIAVLACHNRKAQTVACLEACFASARGHADASAVVVDDGSTDGTAAALTAAFPTGVEVLRGDGSLFWNGGMRRAMESAMAADPDFILWLNDDTTISPDALTVLLGTHDERSAAGDGPATIVVAAIADPDTGRLTYSGMRSQRVSWRPLALDLVVPQEGPPQRCDTMNGNCVLISRAAYRRLGNLSDRFVHGLGDLDYGLRASAQRVPVWLAPGVLGHCRRNAARGSFLDQTLPLGKRWQIITGPKGLPPRAWALYAQRYGGTLWPVHWAWPYVKVLLRARSAREKALS